MPKAATQERPASFSFQALIDRVRGKRQTKNRSLADRYRELLLAAHRSPSPERADELAEAMEELGRQPADLESDLGLVLSMEEHAAVAATKCEAQSAMSAATADVRREGAWAAEQREALEAAIAARLGEAETRKNNAAARVRQAVAAEEALRQAEREWGSLTGQPAADRQSRAACCQVDLDAVRDANATRAKAAADQ